MSCSQTSSVRSRTHGQPESRMPSAAVGRMSDLRSKGRGFEYRPGTRRKNSGQVSHTSVPLFTKQYKLVPAKGR